MIVASYREETWDPTSWEHAECPLPTVMTCGEWNMHHGHGQTGSSPTLSESACALRALTVNLSSPPSAKRILTQCQETALGMQNEQHR